MTKLTRFEKIQTQYSYSFQRQSQYIQTDIIPVVSRSCQTPEYRTDETPQTGI